MYTEHFGFTQKPFQLKTAPLSFYSDAMFETAQRMLRKGVRENRGLTLLTGAAGTGKSMLLRNFMAEMSRSMRFMVFTRTTLSFDDLLAHLCEELGFSLDAESDAERLRQLTEALRGRLEQPTPVLVVEDAHNLDDAALDRLLYFASAGSPEPHGLRIVALGLNELEVRLLTLSVGRYAGGGVGTRCRLEPIEDDEVGTFIQQQLAAAGCQREDLFPPETVARVALHSRGVPRNIMALCDAALFAASLEEVAQVTPALVDQAAGQCFLSDPGPPPTEFRFERELSPADVARAISPAPRVAANPRDAAATPLGGETPPPVAATPAQPDADAALPAGFGDFDDAAAPELDAGLADGLRRFEAQAPRRRGRRPVLLLLMLLLLGAGLAGVYVRPDLVGLEQAQVDFYEARLRNRAGQLLTVAEDWWLEGRRLVAHLRGETPPPRIPPEADAGTPPQAATPSTTETGAVPAPPAMAEAPGVATEPDPEPIPDLEIVAAPDAGAEPPPPAPIPEPGPEPSPAAPAAAPEPAPTAATGDDATTAPPAAPAPSPSPSPALPVENRNLAPERPLHTVETVALEARIETLLDEAERQIAQERLTTPADDNALGSYRAILDLDPTHAGALAGLDAIENLYREWAQSAAARGNWDRARRFYERALVVDPDDQELTEALAALPE